jgi:hypothetical protein
VGESLRGCITITSCNSQIRDSFRYAPRARNAANRRTADGDA